VAAVASAVEIPVSADLEAGYDDAEATVTRALAAGAVGFNLEDGRADGTLTPLDEQLTRVRAARAAVDASSVPAAFLNARTDTIWLGTGDESETIARIRAYAQAGADGIFIPGLEDPALISRLVTTARGAGATLNLLAIPGLPPIADLTTLGIARISTGSGPARAALSTLHTAATELLTHGTYGAATSGSLSWADLNAMMAG
jgi:2-methylisocitrate lyase-like PEP mutase family enzyme